MKPTIYLFFKGNCLEAMTHYAETLGGKVTGVFRNGDAPADSRMPGGDDLVMNMAVDLDGSLVMASDNPEGMYDRPQGFSVTVETPSAPEFDRVFAALSDGAEAIAMAPGETFWAERFAMFRDRFGIPWMLSFTGSKGAQP
ncbi:VOC family protein [Paracoccus benzoatiresistens]|uniref:VOC family protein n=1 Tax=Paracoccus benzoatiresistens TaxID=2997341 RepID=A0ABT4J1R5_9RHOB|nr:VOC family protein [Paracoccus sp. EF6]MCZ0960582.1 VOC family protein [Paracoccus sp. EF6]